ncbi:SCP2 domain-containing protein [Pusillimonas sp.]|uniref:SCP2 domain-containing protein n=1 Tax=Pusillimonas sp. TaxID=3040095 RepID=UPI0037C8D1DF
MLAFPPLPAPASVCARLLNSLLRREDWAKERLERHAGKSVRFVAAPWQISLSIRADGLVEASDQAIVPDVTLTLPGDKLAQVPAILRRGDTDEITALLHIQGDAGLAQVVSELARGLRWDAEDDLARVVGDVAAVRLMGVARGLAKGAERSVTRMAENVGEYLAEENPQVLGRYAFEDWRGRLDAMGQRLLQLERRVERLEQYGVRAGRA